MNAPVPMRHCVVVGEPPVVNVKVGVGSLVRPVGPPVIATVGGVASTVKARLADAVLPAASVAVTVKVCAPSASAVVVKGEAHAAAAPPSSAHCTGVGEPPVVNVKV